MQELLDGSDSRGCEGLGFCYGNQCEGRICVDVWEQLREMGTSVGSGRSWSEIRWRLELFVGAIMDWRGVVSLTSAASVKEIVERHVADSLVACIVAGNEEFDGCVDIGSGAGFPGLPAAICFPDKRVCLLESRLRRALFLERCCRLLELRNVAVIRDRAENVQSKAELGDPEVCFARAVAQPHVVSALVRPLIVDGGRLLVHVGEGRGCIDWGAGWRQEGTVERKVGQRRIRVAVVRAVSL